MLTPTVIAIPIFALLIAVEAYLVIRENRENFDCKDTWANIFIGFLSVAVRQSWFSGIAHWIIYLPIAFLGFPIWAFLTMHGLNLIYQFWIHTKLVGRIGFLEKILNTPSHHRVHHGVNDDYLDRNYAGVFIIWDKLFGTFTEETEEPRYGIIKPIESYNWLWINSHGWAEMFAAVREKKTFVGKLRCVFGSPDMNFEETPTAVKMPSN